MFPLSILSIVLFLLFLAANFEASAESLSCTNFYASACSRHSESINDGTGTHLSPADYDRNLQSTMGRLQTQYINREVDALTDDPFIRSRAISAFRLGSSLCRNEAEISQECRDALKARISQLSLRQVFGKTQENTQNLLTEIDPTAASLFLQTKNVDDFLYNLHGKAEQTYNDGSVLQARRKLEGPNGIIERVKLKLIEKINSSNATNSAKNYLTSKIRNISFEGTDCSRLRGQKVPHLVLPNAFYDGARNSITVCSGLLMRTDSEFQLTAIVAHELSHSIDPCSIALLPGQSSGFSYSNPSDLETSTREHPFGSVLNCLRTPDSVEAKRLSPSCIRRMQQRPRNPENEPANPFCRVDQITESFSDWSSANITAELMSERLPPSTPLTSQQFRDGYTNFARTFCGNDGLYDVNGSGCDSHPSHRSRIDRILMANPRVYSQMSCSLPKPIVPVQCEQTEQTTFVNPPITRPRPIKRRSI